ncbi:uncharacterized protein F4812DRAFT_248966 [Daldinia caldariorum]|uniref:uncharacterized protein n=1 Tax=Daldinia caldariorum TaxID=326644 RepID=UPI002007B8A4|nr:uncharacterized protein F4812DRAFT_248966 [Daldinia caldariorum]KAI1463457.1 hypothetical protein F4812DRAFT_248966 [Daldinia caldariorum]
MYFSGSNISTSSLLVFFFHAQRTSSSLDHPCVDNEEDIHPPLSGASQARRPSSAIRREKKVSGGKDQQPSPSYWRECSLDPGAMAATWASGLQSNRDIRTLSSLLARSPTKIGFCKRIKVLGGTRGLQRLHHALRNFGIVFFRRGFNVRHI